MADLLFLKLIESSPEIEIDGETIIDLTVPILNRNQVISFKDNDRIYEIGSELLAKPTILSKFVYGDAGKIDLLAYYNGYSNPFAMLPGQLLKVPTVDKIDSIINNGQDKNVNLAKVELNKKASVVDAKRKGILAGDVERPNMSKSSAQNKKEGDLIILGNYSQAAIRIKFDEITARNKVEKNFLEDVLVDHFEERLKGN